MAEELCHAVLCCVSLSCIVLHCVVCFVGVSAGPRWWGHSQVRRRNIIGELAAEDLSGEMSSGKWRPGDTQSR